MRTERERREELKTIRFAQAPPPKKVTTIGEAQKAKYYFENAAQEANRRIQQAENIKKNLVQTLITIQKDPHKYQIHDPDIGKYRTVTGRDVDRIKANINEIDNYIAKTSTVKTHSAEFINKLDDWSAKVRTTQKRPPTVKTETKWSVEWEGKENTFDTRESAQAFIDMKVREAQRARMSAALGASALKTKEVKERERTYKPTALQKIQESLTFTRLGFEDTARKWSKAAYAAPVLGKVLEAMESYENAFSFIPKQDRKLSGALFREAEEMACKGGSWEGFGRYMAGVGVAASAVAFDAVTFPVRPGLWVKTAKGYYQLATDRDVRAALVKEIARDPFKASVEIGTGLYTGYFTGKSVGKIINKVQKIKGGQEYVYFDKHGLHTVEVAKVLNKDTSKFSEGIYYRVGLRVKELKFDPITRTEVLPKKWYYVSKGGIGSVQVDPSKVLSKVVNGKKIYYFKKGLKYIEVEPINIEPTFKVRPGHYLLQDPAGKIKMEISPSKFYIKGSTGEIVIDLGGGPGRGIATIKTSTETIKILLKEGKWSERLSKVLNNELSFHSLPILETAEGLGSLKRDGYYVPEIVGLGAASTVLVDLLKRERLTSSERKTIEELLKQLTRIQKSQLTQMNPVNIPKEYIKYIQRAKLKELELLTPSIRETLRTEPIETVKAVPKETPKTSIPLETPTPELDTPPEYEEKLKPITPKAKSVEGKKRKTLPGEESYTIKFTDYGGRSETHDIPAKTFQEAYMKAVHARRHRTQILEVDIWRRG